MITAEEARNLHYTAEHYLKIAEDAIREAAKERYAVSLTGSIWSNDKNPLWREVAQRLELAGFNVKYFNGTSSTSIFWNS